MLNDQWKDFFYWLAVIVAAVVLGILLNAIFSALGIDFSDKPVWA